MTKSFEITAFWRRLGSCRQGVTALEFAFAAPVVIAAVAAAIELAMVMFVTSLAEGALREASRFGITGAISAGISREQKIADILLDHTIGLVEAAGLTVNYKVYPAFGDVGKPEPFTDAAPVNGQYDAGEAFNDINGNGEWDADMGAAGMGGPGDVVLYTVAFDWALLTPLFTAFAPENGKLRLSASVAVRNEPYNVLPPQGSDP